MKTIDELEIPEYNVCKKCVLTDNIPGVTFDKDGVCDICNEYKDNYDRYNQYFGNRDDFKALVEKVNEYDKPHYDCLLLFSGGKDSTYVLLNLLDMGYKVLAFTFDNGFISPVCKENIKRTCEYLNVDYVIGSLQQATMNKVFKQSLKEKASVCFGCWRGLNARSSEIAIERNIRVIINGLSRGQIFQLRAHDIVKQNIQGEEQIEFYLKELRKYYHEVDNEVVSDIKDNALLDKSKFDETLLVDFFRYDPVEKPQILQTLKDRLPFWKIPENVGLCSSNCMINDVGTYVHLKKKGYHNYAVPTAWEVRFGHLSREAAMKELEIGEIDTKRVKGILKKLGEIGTESEEEKYSEKLINKIDEDF